MSGCEERGEEREEDECLFPRVDPIGNRQDLLQAVEGQQEHQQQDPSLGSRGNRDQDGQREGDQQHDERLTGDDQEEQRCRASGEQRVDDPLVVDDRVPPACRSLPVRADPGVDLGQVTFTAMPTPAAFRSS